MSHKIEARPGNPDSYRVVVDVSRHEIPNFRVALGGLFEEGVDIVSDEERDGREEQMFKERLKGKIDDFLAPKDQQTEEKIAENLKLLLPEIFEWSMTKIAAFHLETPAEIQQARRILHELCSNIPKVGLRDEVVLVERYGLIDGISKTLKDTGHIIGVGPSQAGSIERRTLARLRRGYQRPQTSPAYSDLIPAVLELRKNSGFDVYPYS